MVEVKGAERRALFEPEVGARDATVVPRGVFDEFEGCVAVLTPKGKGGEGYYSEDQLQTGKERTFDFAEKQGVLERREHTCCGW